MSVKAASKGYVSNVITCKLHTSPCRKNVATILLYKIPYVSYVSYVSLDAANICTPVSLAILESILLHGLGKLKPLKPLKPLAILLSTFTTYHYVTAWFCWQTSPRMNTPWMSLMFSVHVMLILNCQRFRSRTPRLSRDILWQTIWPFRSACLSIFLLKQNCNMAAANSIVKILKVRALQNSEVASWCHAQSCEYFFLPVLNLAWMQRSDTCRELDLTLHPGTSSVTQIYAPVPFRYLNQQVVS